jgi:hypothetical protein
VAAVRGPNSKKGKKRYWMISDADLDRLTRKEFEASLQVRKGWGKLNVYTLTYLRGDGFAS